MCGYAVYDTLITTIVHMSSPIWEGGVVVYPYFVPRHISYSDVDLRWQSGSPDLDLTLYMPTQQCPPSSPL